MNKFEKRKEALRIIEGLRLNVMRQAELLNTLKLSILSEGKSATLRKGEDK